MDSSAASTSTRSIIIQIIGKRKVGSRVEYKIRWRGYTPEEDTWEPADNVEQSAIDEFQPPPPPKRSRKAGAGARGLASQGPFVLSTLGDVQPAVAEQRASDAAEFLDEVFERAMVQLRRRNVSAFGVLLHAQKPCPAWLMAALRELAAREAVDKLKLTGACSRSTNAPRRCSCDRHPPCCR